MRAPAQYQVGSSLGAAAQEFRDFARKMLPVGVDSDDSVKAVREGPGESALQGRRFATPARVWEHQSSLRRGRALCAIDGPVIDHDDIRQLVPAGANDGADGVLGVESRNHHHEALAQPGPLAKRSTASRVSDPARRYVSVLRASAWTGVS